MIWLEALVVIIGYLLGSIPSAYIVGRLKGMDIRDVGGGNPGALNAWRKIGRDAGIAVLLVDVAKGVGAVLIARWFGVPHIVVLVAGLAAVLGHDLPIFFGFKGGKGAATTMGVLLTLVPHQFLIAFGIGVVVILITRNVTLGMGIQFISLPLALWCFSYSGLLIGYSAALPLISGVRHLPTLREALATQSKRDIIFDRWQRRGS
jgi:glycerol-3-phosphate acyltransferase PlsY